MPVKAATPDLTGQQWLRIMELARELGIDFAFPTRTLLIETPPEADVGLPREAVSAVLGRR